MNRTLLLTTLLAAHAALAATPRVVMVLYFDNNTGKSEYDVLQKGLADMLITDLAGTEALQVVEREKLQAALDELSLQRTKYFDPKTAQKIGKGVGAQYAVTGAIAAVEPQLRIDIRLFEVASMKVLVTDKVIGHKDSFFEMEEQLVAKFLAGLAAKEGGAAARSGQTNVANLLLYSQALDAADSGDLKGASQKMAAVVRNAPDFSLAKQKYGELLKRLREAGKKRQAALSEAEETLIRKLASFISTNPAELDARKRALHFGARYQRGAFLLHQLKKSLTEATAFGAHHVDETKRADFEPWLKEFVQNYELLISEMEAVEKATPDEKHWRFSGNLPPDVVRLVTELGIKDGAHDRVPRNLESAYEEFAGFLFMGRIFWISMPPFRPSPAQQDPKLARRALELVSLAQKRIAKLEPANREREEADVIDVAGEGLVLLGRKEEAVAQWQLYLDSWPRGSKYGDFETKIEDVLGVSEKAEKFEKTFATCANELVMPIMEETRRVARADGVTGLRRLGKRLDEACKGSFLLFSYAIYAAMSSAEIGDCTYVRELREKVTPMGEQMLKSFNTSIPLCL